MGERELVEYLSTIAVSGTNEAKKAGRARKGQKNSAISPLMNRSTIGQFGIGILSAFVVASRIDVFTRKAGEAAWKWSSEGDEEYDLDQIQASDLRHGSRVVLAVKPEYRPLIETAALGETIKKYCDFIPYGIFLNGDGPINTIDAPWHRGFAAYSSRSDYLSQVRKFLDDRYNDLPIHVMPIEFTKPYARGALYISDRRVPLLNTSGVLDIFQSRVCVRTEDREILPKWAKFVNGIIDSPELQPTAARDNVMRNDVYREIRSQLGELIISDLKSLRKDDPSRFRRICRFHHYHLKGMALHNKDFFDVIIDMLPFQTNRGEMDLAEYTSAQSREEGGRIPIYFFSFGGDSNQFFDVANARGFVAINTGAVFDEELIRKYVELRPSQYVLRQLDSLDDEAIYQSVSATERDAFAELVASATAALSEEKLNVKLQMRRFKPASLSGVILETKRLDALERLRGQLETAAAAGDSAFDELAQQTEMGLASQPLDLFLNADNTLIGRLSKRNDLRNSNRRSMLINLYNAAFLNAQHRMTPSNARIFYNQMHEQAINLLDLEDKLSLREDLTAQNLKDLEITKVALSDATQAYEEMQKLLETAGDGRGLVPADVTNERSRWVKVFMMTPYSPNYNPLENAVRDILEDAPYWFEVHLAKDRTFEPQIAPNIVWHMNQADAFIAEISEVNANVMMELGWVYFSLHSKVSREVTSKRPVMMLWCSSEAKGDRLPSNIAGAIHIERRELSASDLEADLRSRLDKIEPLQRLRELGRERFLSLNTLQKVVLPQQARRLKERYKTIEELLSADASHIQDVAERHVMALAQNYFEKG